MHVRGQGWYDVPALALLVGVKVAVREVGVAGPGHVLVHAARGLPVVHDGDDHLRAQAPAPLKHRGLGLHGTAPVSTVRNHEIHSHSKPLQ